MSAVTKQLDVEPVFRGDALAIPISVTASTLALLGGTLVGATIKCSVRRYRNSAATIADATTDAGSVQIVDADEAIAAFDSGDTLAWPISRVHYDVQVDKAGARHTVQAGRLTVSPRITNARGTDVVAIAGASSSTLPMPAFVATGTFSSGIGALNSTLPLPIFAATGSLAIRGQASTTLQAPSLSATGLYGLTAELDGLASAPTALFCAGRRLLSIYTGPLIRVRRGGPGGEQDIGYDANNVLDTADMISFCAGNGGAVVTIYDQTGNGRHLTQASAPSQPIIYTGSVVNTLGSTPAPNYNGSKLARADSFGLSGATGITVWCVWQATSRNGNAGPYALGGPSGAGAFFSLFADASDTDLRVYIGGGVRDFTTATIISSNNTIARLAASQTISSATLRRNGSQLEQSGVISGSTALNLANSLCELGNGSTPGGGAAHGGPIGALAVWGAAISDGDCAILDAVSTARYGT